MSAPGPRENLSLVRPPPAQLEPLEGRDDPTVAGAGRVPMQSSVTVLPVLWVIAPRARIAPPPWRVHERSVWRWWARTPSPSGHNPPSIHRRIGRQTVTAQDRAAAPVLGRPTMLFLDRAVGAGWSSHPPAYCPAPWWETGPGCRRPWRRAGEERVRRTLALCRRSGISVRQEPGARFCRGAGRRPRAAPPPDDLKIVATHVSGTHFGGNCAV